MWSTSGPEGPPQRQHTDAATSPPPPLTGPSTRTTGLGAPPNRNELQGSSIKSPVSRKTTLSALHRESCTACMVIFVIQVIQLPNVAQHQYCFLSITLLSASCVLKPVPRLLEIKHYAMMSLSCLDGFPLGLFRAYSLSCRKAGMQTHRFGADPARLSLRLGLVEDWGLMTRISHATPDRTLAWWAPPYLSLPLQGHERDKPPREVPRPQKSA